MIALILLVGTIGFGLTLIARTEQHLVEEPTESSDQVAANQTLLS
jgi:hypothetical protein